MASLRCSRAPEPDAAARASARAGRIAPTPSVTFQSAVVTRPGHLAEPVGELAVRPLRPRDGLRLGPQADGHVRRPRGGRAVRTSATLGVGRRRAASGTSARRAGRHANTLPYDRSGHAMVYDTVRKKTFMFSGWQPGAGFYIPDQWEWDGSAQTWTERAGRRARSRRRATAPRWSGTATATAPSCSAASTTATGARCNDIWEWDGTASDLDRPDAASGTKPSPRSRRDDRLRRRPQEDGRSTAATPAPASATGDRAPGSTRPGSGTAPPGRGRRSRRAVGESHHVLLRLLPAWPTTPAAARSSATTTQTNIWEYNPVDARPGRGHARRRPRSTPATPPYNNAARLRLRPRRSGDVRRAVGYAARAVGAERRRLHLDQPVGPGQRSDPAAVPVDRLRQQARQADACSAATAAPTASTSRTPGSGRGPASTLINRTTGGDEAAGPPARPAMVYDSKRDRMLLFGGYGATASRRSLDVDPDTRNWAQITVTRARGRRRATASGCSTTRPATRSTSTARAAAATTIWESIRPRTTGRTARVTTRRRPACPAQLLRRRLRHRPQQDASMLGGYVRRRRTTPTSGSGTRPPASGRRAMPAASAPVPTAATTTRSPTTPSGA